MNKEIEDQVRKLYWSGLMDREVAEELGIGRTTVLSIRKRLDLPARGRPFDEHRAHEAAMRYEAGESAYALGKEYGVAHTTVLGWLRRLNVRVRSTKLQVD